MMKTSWVLTAFLVAALGLGCRSAYYSAWESLGKQKRDLLQTKVRQVRDEQQQASEQLKDALTRLREAYAVNGGEIEKFYDGLKRDYDRADSQAGEVRQRIRQMDQIAQDLFKEWEKEAASITSENLRDSSRQQMRATRQRYDELNSAVTRAERSMEPVLTKFRDYTLFLKHNLNAQAIGSLQGEADSIQQAITRLIEDMNNSIRKADDFIKAIP